MYYYYYYYYILKIVSVCILNVNVNKPHHLMCKKKKQDSFLARTLK